MKKNQIYNITMVWIAVLNTIIFVHGMNKNNDIPSNLFYTNMLEYTKSFVSHGESIARFKSNVQILHSYFDCTQDQNKISFDDRAKQSVTQQARNTIVWLETKRGKCENNMKFYYAGLCLLSMPLATCTSFLIMEKGERDKELLKYFHAAESVLSTCFVFSSYRYAEEIAKKNDYQKLINVIRNFAQQHNLFTSQC